MSRHVFVWILAMFFIPGVLACSCIATTPDERYASADAVFTGEILNLTRTTGGLFSEDIKIAEIAVDTVWKGKVRTEEVVFTPPNSAACGVTFRDHEQYLIYATYQEDDTLQATLCSGTALISDVENDRDYLWKNHRAYEPEPPETDTAERSWFEHLIAFFGSLFWG